MVNISPLRFPGGKYGLSKFIAGVAKANGCRKICEVYCGGAAVGLSLLHAGLIEEVILNDADTSIYLLWKVILEQPAELIRLIETTSINVNDPTQTASQFGWGLKIRL